MNTQPLYIRRSRWGVSMWSNRQLVASADPNKIASLIEYGERDLKSKVVVVPRSLIASEDLSK